MASKNSENERLTVVIFGASGDLTHRKLAPALFHLYKTGALPQMCHFVGVSRSDMSDDEFRKSLAKAAEDVVNEDKDVWKEFADRVTYISGSSTEDDSLKEIDKTVAEFCDDGSEDNRLYYMALAPSLYSDTLKALGRCKMLDEKKGYRRVVIEKPFGTDLKSAQELNEVVHSVLTESQVFRIDHYLGKETVQNLLIFRFANTIFEPVWNRHYVDHVQISVLESVDTAGRAGYYDDSGVLRDMMQSHLLQLMALVAMEPPATSGANALRNEKAKVLQSVSKYETEAAAVNSVRGQYKGYREEEGVDDSSSTATYGAIRLQVNNWRWQGVPFYMRSGKALAEKTSEISVQFRPPPHTIFETRGPEVTPNLLQISIQPDEGVHLTFENKKPGTRMGTAPERLVYHFPPQVIRDSYERLLLDAIEGDQSLFTRSDEIELSWQIIDPFVEAWENSLKSQLYPYEKGSMGPGAADEFLGKDSTWHLHSSEDSAEKETG